VSPFASAPAGQQPSPSAFIVTRLWAQPALQLLALPVGESVVQASPSSQLVGHADGGSQVSPGSSAPSPHVNEQSLSGVTQPAAPGAQQAAGQQPSPSTHAVMVLLLQEASHVPADPLMESAVQLLPSSQLVGQLPVSHPSPISSTPFPHMGTQSESTLALPNDGQQPSPSTNIPMMVPPDIVAVGVEVHVIPQPAPSSVSVVQASPSSHVVGHAPGPPAAMATSHVSMPFTRPSPQASVQLLRQPSSSLLLPSSHCSGATMTPSPQPAGPPSLAASLAASASLPPAIPASVPLSGSGTAASSPVPWRVQSQLQPAPPAASAAASSATVPRRT